MGLDSEPRAPRWRIAVHVRRGDGGPAGLTRPLGYFVGLLERVLRLPPVAVDKARVRIMVLSQTREVSAFEDAFGHFPGVSFRLHDVTPDGQEVVDGGPPPVQASTEKEKFSLRQLLVEDLDLMATSQLLLLSPGGFSALGAAVQREGGVSFAPEDMTPVGLGNVVKVDTTGHFLARPSKLFALLRAAQRVAQ